MYGQEQNTRESIIEEYGKDLERLLRYLPYLEKKKGDAQKFYEGDGNNKVIPVPVYDSTLLGFVKEARATKFMNRNYPYTYRRFRMYSPADERKEMQKAKITDIELFKGIFSKYVMEGQRKGSVWTVGLQEEIFVTFLKCLKKLFFEYSSEPGKINKV